MNYTDFTHQDVALPEWRGPDAPRFFFFPFPLFFFFFLFSPRSLASLISLCWCHMLNHRKRERINQYRGLSPISTCGVGSSKRHPLPPFFLSARAKKNGQAGTWKCQHVELWRAWSHNSCPCSTQSILSIRSNEKQSGKDQQLGADLRAPGLVSCSSLQSYELRFFSMGPYLPLEQAGIKRSSCRGGKKKKRKRKREKKCGGSPVYHLEQRLSIEQVASGFRSPESRCLGRN